MSRDALWPVTEGEVLRFGKVSSIPTTENPAVDEQLNGQGPVDQGFLQNSDGKAFPYFTVYGHLDGARLAFNTIAKVDVGTAGQRTSFLDSTGLAFIWFDGLLTADITVSGAGGLRAALSEAADTWYAVFLIADTTGVNATAVFLDISATAPVLPAGYDVFRRVGWWRNDGSSDQLKFEQFDTGRDRRVEYDEERSVTQILSGGNATVYTDVSAASFMAPSARHGVMHYEWDPANPANQFNIRPKGSTVTAPVFTIATRNDQEAGSHPFFTDSNQDIQFKVSTVGDALDLFVAGYVDNL